MDLTRIMLMLRSEFQDVQKRILSVERFDRRCTGTETKQAQSATEARMIRKRHTRAISELRSDREHIEHAIRSLAVLERLRRTR